MEFYDILYPKEALDTYNYLFVNEKISSSQADKIKNLLYASYLYIFQHMQENDWGILYDFIYRISDIQQFDYILSNVETIRIMYELYPIHEGLKNNNVEYQECFLILKRKIVDSKFDDLIYFLNTKNSVDEFVDKLSKGIISESELQQSNDDIQEKIAYLERYLPKIDIEAYKGYLKFKNGKMDSAVLNFAMNMLDVVQVNYFDVHHSNDLKEKGKMALPIAHFEKINLTANEQREIRNYASSKIGKMIMLILIILVFFSGIFTSATNSNYFIPLAIIGSGIVLCVINIIKNLIILLRANKTVDGAIGFISDTNRNRKSVTYDIYFPKYNESVRVNKKNTSVGMAKLDMSNLSRNKTMVIYINVLNQKFTITADIEKYFDANL